MSSQNALEFMKAVYSDIDLQKQLRPLDLQNQPAQDQAKLLQIAKAAGYDFTIEEWSASAMGVAKQMRQDFWQTQPDGTLSEEQLAAVAGGKGSSSQSPEDIANTVTWSLFSIGFGCASDYYRNVYCNA